MAKIVGKNEKTVVMEISRTELHVYVQAQVNMVDGMDIESVEDQQNALLMLSAIEPLLPLALPATQSFFEEVKKEVVEIEWEDDETIDGVDNEEDEEESSDQDNSESGQDSGEGDEFIES